MSRRWARLYSCVVRGSKGVRKTPASTVFLTRGGSWGSAFPLFPGSRPRCRCAAGVYAVFELCSGSWRSAWVLPGWCGLVGSRCAWVFGLWCAVGTAVLLCVWAEAVGCWGAPGGRGRRRPRGRAPWLPGPVFVLGCVFRGLGAGPWELCKPSGVVGAGGCRVCGGLGGGGCSTSSAGSSGELEEGLAEVEGTGWRGCLGRALVEGGSESAGPYVYGMRIAIGSGGVPGAGESGNTVGGRPLVGEEAGAPGWCYREG